MNLFSVLQTNALLSWIDRENLILHLCDLQEKMAPKPRKPLKNKDAVEVFTTKDATSANTVKDKGQSTEKTTSVQRRRVAKKKQTCNEDKFEAIDADAPEMKVARRTKQTKGSCSQKKGTTDSIAAREKPKSGRSQWGKASGADSDSGLLEMKISQRQSKTKAKSKITQHFDDTGETRLDDGSALKKESKMWGEITRIQKRESGMMRRNTGGKQKDNEGDVEKEEDKASDDVNETEELTSKTGARKRKGKAGVGTKSTISQKAQIKQMKADEDVQKDAACLVKEGVDTAMDADTCVQEAAKGNRYIGAHTSIAGGLYNAVLGAVAIGAKAFGLFLRNQRQWLSKPMSEKDISDFKTAMKDFGFSPNVVVPHGSYLMNCGSPNDELLQKSRDLLLDELQRCEQLGLVMFNFHPGSTRGEISRSESIQRIADSINSVHEKTKYVITVLENMCCQGNTIGGRFTELRSIIDLVHDKSRVGVCIDTCHAFAAGYDLSSEEGYNEMMTDLENIIGLKYLKAVHINDSKGKVGCHLDRHENIGRGHIGMNGFRRLLNDPRFENIPLVLETPAELDDSKEVRMLYALIKV